LNIPEIFEVIQIQWIPRMGFQVCNNLSKTFHTLITASPLENNQKKINIRLVFSLNNLKSHKAPLPQAQFKPTKN